MIDRGRINVMIIGLVPLLLGCSDPEEESKPCDKSVFFVDEDGDGFGSPYIQQEACDAPTGYVGNNEDCDDTDPDQFPEQEWFIDVDGDGFGNVAVQLSACIEPIGYVLDSTDCDDEDATRNPDQQWYVDADSDGFGDVSQTVASCDDALIELAAPESTDCNDQDSMVHPMANEICDAIDNNCDGLVDNDDPTLDIYTQVPFYTDVDGDGFGSEEYVGHFCPSYDLASMSNEDCDDEDAFIHPDQIERYDDVDQNCDGDTLWHNISHIDYGFSHAYSGTQFGRKLDSWDIDGDNVTELVISQSVFSWDQNTDTDDGKVIWVSGSQEADFADLSDQIPFWYGEPDDALYAVWAGDMDGDGVADLLMGSRNKNDYEGAVYVVSSDAQSGLVTEKSAWSWTIPNEDYRVGSSLLRVGDVDSDGLADMVVGASHFDNGANNRGGAFLLRGSDIGTISDPTEGAWIAGTSNGDQFGLVTSRAGDINGDGVLDILVSAIYADEGETASGSVYVFPVTDLMSGTVVPEDMVQFYGEADSDKAGAKLADLGDVNGDGYDDFLIGANDHDEFYDQDGAVYLLYGQSYEDFDLINPLSNADAIFYGANQNSGFADDIEGAGDLDGDGLDDMVIGSYLADPTGSNRGLAIGIFGAQHSGRHNVEAVADFMIRGNAGNTRVGQGFARAGDRNGDGLEDLWIGAYGYNDYSGRILLLHGFTRE